MNRPSTSSRAPRLRWMLALPVVATVTVVTGGAAPPPPELPCTVAARWVESHRALLPTTLEGLSSYPMLYRKAAYRALTTTQRRAVWREHLSTFLGPASPLNARQQASLRGIMTRLDQYVDTTRQSRAAQRRDGLTSMQLRVQFGDRLARAMFATLGPSDPEPNELVAKALRQTGALRASDPKASIQHPNCACSGASDWCSGSSTCNGSNIECITSGSGCGTFWCYSCDGLCYNDE